MRRWTEDEDERIRAAADRNREPGGYTADGEPSSGPRRYAGRLRRLAAELDRTYEAVLQRAHRIHARSKR